MTRAPRSGMSRREYLQCILASTSAAALAGCNPEKQEPAEPSQAAIEPAKPPRAPDSFNIVVIALDALRADHLGCYGYKRNTSPFIDKLATEALVFEQAFSCSSYTRESVTSIWSGRLPARLGAFGWNTRLPPKTPCLGSFFSDAGYKTAVVSNQPAVISETFTRHAAFDEVLSLNKKWVSRTGPDLSKVALELAGKWADQKFLMYMHYLDPHADYRPPDETYFRFTKKRPDNPPHFGTIRENFSQWIDEGFGPGDVRFDDFQLRYDAEIAHSDIAVEVFVKGLEKLGILDKTLVIITSDHGEEFLEHGYLEHSWTVNRESIHVPFIIWAPALFKPQRIESPISLADLLPSLLSMADISYEAKTMDGIPIFAKKNEKLAVMPRTEPIISQVLIQERCIVHAVIQDGWKYLSFHRWVPPKGRPRATKIRKEVAAELRSGKRKPVNIFGSPIREELYNTREDPDEKVDLAGKEPAKLEVLRAALREHAVLCLTEQGKPVTKPKEDVKVSPEEAEQLENIGYL